MIGARSSGLVRFSPTSATFATHNNEPDATCPLLSAPSLSSRIESAAPGPARRDESGALLSLAGPSADARRPRAVLVLRRLAPPGAFSSSGRLCPNTIALGWRGVIAPSRTNRRGLAPGSPPREPSMTWRVVAIDRAVGNP
jgi:hypothetical protein